jgi:hypothetical protein
VPIRVPTRAQTWILTVRTLGLWIRFPHEARIFFLYFLFVLFWQGCAAGTRRDRASPLLIFCKLSQSFCYRQKNIRLYTWYTSIKISIHIYIDTSCRSILPDAKTKMKNIVCWCALLVNRFSVHTCVKASLMADLPSREFLFNGRISCIHFQQW